MSLAPLAVQHLTVYKTARQMLGLRWAEPARTFGHLDSFLVSLQQGEGEPVQEWVVRPTHCEAWPLLFCHTVANLTAETHYTVTVRSNVYIVSFYAFNKGVFLITVHFYFFIIVGTKLRVISECVDRNCFVSHKDLVNTIPGAQQMFN